MPIETAPKDGTDFFASQEGAPECGVIFWDTELKEWCAPAEGYDEPNWTPTHWMPLPAAPGTQGEQKP